MLKNHDFDSVNAVYDIYYRMLTLISLLGYIIVKPALTGTILYPGGYHSEAEMKKSIAVYINRYNSERPHAYLNNTSPEKFEKKYFEKMRQPGTEMNAENLF